MQLTSRHLIRSTPEEFLAQTEPRHKFRELARVYALPFHQVCKRLIEAAARRKGRHRVLIKLLKSEFVQTLAPLDLSPIGADQSKQNVADGRFSCAARPGHGHALAGADVNIQPFEQCLVRVAFAKIGGDQHRTARFRRRARRPGVGFGGEEALRVAVPRRAKNARGFAMLDHLTVQHDRDLSAKRPRNGDVVRDGQHGALLSHRRAQQSNDAILQNAVQALHPPAGAAFSYHNVQAAEIESRASMARARGNAISSIKGAETQALQLSAQAAGTAEEQLQEALRESTLFASERASFERNRTTFLFERWLEKLSRNLAGSDLLIVDHRLAGAGAPTIDLRPIAPGTPPYIPPAPPASPEDHQ